MCYLCGLKDYILCGVCEKYPLISIPFHKQLTRRDMADARIEHPTTVQEQKYPPVRQKKNVHRRTIIIPPYIYYIVDTDFGVQNNNSRAKSKKKTL